MNSKFFLSSKLNWLGIALMVLYGLEKFTETNVLADYPIAMAAVGLAIVVLRAVTTQPVRALP
jgi:hypothetical protein